MQLPGSPNPVTPTKPLRNDWACHDNQDAEIALTQSDEEEEERPKQKRKHTPRVLVMYDVVQLLVTSDKAKQPGEDIQ